MCIETVAGGPLLTVPTSALETQFFRFNFFVVTVQLVLCLPVCITHLPVRGSKATISTAVPARPYS